jgi:hypothetical protein
VGSRASLVPAAALGLLACAAVHAGSSRVLDAEGGQWRVIEDPAEGAQGYVLERLGADGRLDPHFGREGRQPVAISATNDAPTSLRVDAGGRVWLAGASISADQPLAVVERFAPDGSPDIRWGIQGRVQLNPGGIAVKPNDLLPLSDGSVLVAGVAANLDPTRAIVFHLKADGTLDLAFGDRGTWQRARVPDGSTATGLDASSDGSVAVSVAARGAPGSAEIWSLDAGSPRLLLQHPLPEASDGEDVGLAWTGRQWGFGSAGSPTGRVGPAFLDPREEPLRAAPAGAASDPGQGGFSPFASETAAAETAPAPAEDHVRWGWPSLAILLGLAAIGALLARGRRSNAVTKGGARHQS